MKIRDFVTFILILVCCFGSVMAGAQEIKPVKYVFLFIGDGFSIPQRMMTEEYLKRKGEPPLYLNSFPNHVLTTTFCSNSFITDSAASGTAIACGDKTNSGSLGVGPDGTTRYESTAEVARDAGRRVGIVTSVTLNHATPAAFYAHNASRGAGYEIGLDLIASQFDYFAGGGIDKQNDEKSEKYKGSIYELAAESGYKVLHNPDEIRALTAESGKVIACLESGALPYAIDGNDGVTLAEYTKKGIELLDNPKGFFMMVEGGKIDWMCHANDAATVLREVLEFDKAVQVARDFMQEHAEETIIVVTGDHETGGLTLGFAGTGYQSFIEILEQQKCSLDTFIATMNEIAKEKGEALTYDDFKPLITEKFGLLFESEDKENRMLLSEGELERLKSAYEKSYGGEKKKAQPLALAVLGIFDNKAGLGWTSTAHTALPVDTSAIGVEADCFTGMIDNTDIAKKLKQLVK